MKKLISLVLALAMILALTACGGSKTEAPKAETPKAEAPASAPEEKAEEKAPELDTKNPIKVGYLAWASGPDAYFGLVAIAALEDRIEEINANGGLLGRKVELVWYDISADFSESVNATVATL